MDKRNTHVIRSPGEIPDIRDILRQGLEEYGLTDRIDPWAVTSLDEYCQLLLEKNQVMNLTAITEPEQVARLHMLDCAALLKFCDFQGKTLIDVGTGAGFPGLPLKILEPSIRLTLLDAQRKRVDFLREVCEDLGLADVECVHGRAEAFAADHREGFDIAVSRAVASLPVLAELCLPLVKVGGQFLAMKSTGSGQEATAAAHAIRLLGGRVTASEDYVIPGAGVTHRLLIVKKAAPTLKGYPRR